MSEPQRQQREIYYAGHVQGVGFRYTVRSLAAGFDVTGFVRNLPDGRVQVVVEGQPREIDEFLDSVQREMSHYIQAAHQTTLSATGRFAMFEIRH
ncbi:MAG: acylphosphatase [Thermoguttaceae bacterium]